MARVYVWEILGPERVVKSDAVPMSVPTTVIALRRVCATVKLGGRVLTVRSSNVQ
jgi:hypothetical protein